ncbi:MAG TPA: organomercurial lyase [Anaerohalosphaeraceae bacterium]|nr:thioredoxin fold domain-containing protein [Phycisphaerae bacterium]HOK94576.1 organomercurial lyase [Anaerohalosphaeraceae bacterium]HOL31513.1 organomercurial lyase [Anaerohalosphaeraceae bacterium]HOM75564.1 organomercurial lyase [Anaerohalosphaeraceae bacterium]HPC64346.1 organomercurial lyase [Anaerohalosphaeraceae bacterium]
MNKMHKIMIVMALAVLVGVVIVMKQQEPQSPALQNTSTQQAQTAVSELPVENKAASPMPAAKPGTLPMLLDLGADKCVPCKMMAPILEALKKEYEGKLHVVFIDVWDNPNEASRYGIRLIPTQIFYDAGGRELFRHEGFISKEDILTKWKELGVNLADAGGMPPAFERLVPARADTRPKEQICYMCDGDISPQTLVTVKTDKGDVRLCGLHCYFIMYSCLMEDKTDFENKVTVSDFESGRPVPLTEAVFLAGTDAKGRPMLRAYANADAANQARQTDGGNVIGLQALRQNELSCRCGFCDRACYPQDAAEVIVEGGLRTWGCCSHCALGVAARTGKDIEIHEKDRLTGEPIIVKTLNGSILSLDPPTAVAWFGQRQKPDGSWTSAGCFHQGFFVNPDNLIKWVEQNPYETGRLISIHQALADKMKLSPEQIQKACKIGECTPK